MKQMQKLLKSYLKNFLNQKIESFNTLYSNDWIMVILFHKLLATDEVPDQYSAQVAIYRMMRPGEPPTRRFSQSFI